MRGATLLLGLLPLRSHSWQQEYCTSAIESHRSGHCLPTNIKAVKNKGVYCQSESLCHYQFY
jgi:hypothetical protein